MKLYKNNQSGFAALAAVLIVVVLAAIGGAAFFVMSRNSDEKNNSTELTKSEKKAVEAECKKQIDDKDFCKFASNISLSGEYRLTISSPDGKVVSDVDGENSSVVMTGSDGVEAKFIYLNGTTYTFNPEDSSWYKYTADTTNDVSVDINEEFNFDDETVPEAEREKYVSKGKEACGNLKCFKYQIVDPSSPESEQYVWFDDDEYKLRRFTIVDGDQTSDGTIEYVSVDIKEPSPVKEVAQPEGVPTEEELQQYLNSLQ